jgi:phosphinothricin acetyltransferase
MKTIRIAKQDDTASVLSIYAPYIQKTSFTFETEVPSIQEFQERINLYLNSWPWIVCDINGETAGYAYATKHRERTAYQWCAESSVYVHDDFLRNGVAKALYSALIEILKLQGYRNLYAVINLPNDKSVAFHEHIGFTYFATYENVGYKLGKWKNVGWWQLQLNEYTTEPSAPIKFSEMDFKTIESIFKSAEKYLK